MYQLSGHLFATIQTSNLRSACDVDLCPTFDLKPIRVPFELWSWYKWIAITLFDRTRLKIPTELVCRLDGFICSRDPTINHGPLIFNAFHSLNTSFAKSLLQRMQTQVFAIFRHITPCAIKPCHSTCSLQSFIQIVSMVVSNKQPHPLHYRITPFSSFPYIQADRQRTTHIVITGKCRCLAALNHWVFRRGTYSPCVSLVSLSLARST